MAQFPSKTIILPSTRLNNFTLCVKNVKLQLSLTAIKVSQFWAIKIRKLQQIEIMIASLIVK